MVSSDFGSSRDPPRLCSFAVKGKCFSGACGVTVGQRPVLLGHEGLDQTLPFAYEPHGDRLNAPGRQPFLNLLPEHWRQLVAYQPVQHPTSLLRVDAIHIDGSRVFDGLLNRLPRDLVELYSAWLFDLEGFRKMYDEDSGEALPELGTGYAGYRAPVTVTVSAQPTLVAVPAAVTTNGWRSSFPASTFESEPALVAGDSVPAEVLAHQSMPTWTPPLAALVVSQTIQGALVATLADALNGI